MASHATYLVFPGGMAESLAFKSAIEVTNPTIIGASSVASDPAISLYDQWGFLPFIGAENFDAALIAAIATHRVSTIFTPHSVIARHLQRLIDTKKISVNLVIEPQAGRATQAQKATLQRIDHMLRPPLYLDMAGEAAALTKLQLAALIHHSNNIVGSTSDEKLLAMAEIFRSCPTGDIVEIGTFWGRSAAILAMLGTHYAIGPLLCIDPWLHSEAMQDGITEDVNDATRALDLEAAFRGFLIGVAPYAAPGMVNYLRTTSDLACATYTNTRAITSPELGTTHYSGGIACLHIDGNHGLAAATRDIENWAPLVVDGGWIIMDDYQWAFGDGPRVAADGWMDRNHQHIERAFAIGSALFIKLGTVS